MASRRPVVAGQFYPASPKKLREMVAGYIDDSGVEPAPERVAAIVAPHAGYIYSGATAGYAYARIRGKKPKRVILAGSSHRSPISTASVHTRGVFDTLLGSFPIDEAFVDELARATESPGPEPHLLEHALEVQLPFLHATIGEVPIVPILFGANPNKWHAAVGAKLAEMVDDTDLLVASTDLSHYLNEETANQLDKHTIEIFLSKDTDALAAGLRDGTCSLCGGAAVHVAMTFAAAVGATNWSVLDYRTSGAVSGDYDRVVGYAAASMERGA